MTDWPKHYQRLPFPDLEGKLSWYNSVADRARILDPDFHGGKTEAIRMIVGHEDTVKHNVFGRPYPARVPIVGEWIEFRNYKEANSFVQAWKRLGQ